MNLVWLENTHLLPKSKLVVNPFDAVIDTNGTKYHK